MKYLALFVCLFPFFLKAQPPIATKEFAVTEGLSAIKIYRIDAADTTNLNDTVRKLQSHIHFDRQGRIIRLSNGYNTNHYEYDSSGKVIRIAVSFKSNPTRTETYVVHRIKDGGYKYNRYHEGNKLKFQVITNEKDVILKIRQLISSGDVYDSTLRIYNPELYYDSIIYFKNGKPLHQFYEQWIVKDSVPVEFIKGFDQFSPGEGRGKTYKVQVTIDSSGTPIYPPKEGNHFRAFEFNFYNHAPKYIGEEEPWKDKRILKGWPKYSKWFELPTFVGPSTFYRSEYEYIER